MLLKNHRANSWIVSLKLQVQALPTAILLVGVYIDIVNTSQLRISIHCNGNL